MAILGWHNAQLSAAFDAAVRSMPVPVLDLAPEAVQAVFDADLPQVLPHPETGEPLGNGNADTIYRLRLGIERFLITDINSPAASARSASEVWFMFDQAYPSLALPRFNHAPGGSNVLYLDGQVAHVPYGGETLQRVDGLLVETGGTPPVTPSVMSALGGIGSAR